MVSREMQVATRRTKDEPVGYASTTNHWHMKRVEKDINNAITELWYRVRDHPDFKALCLEDKQSIKRSMMRSAKLLLIKVKSGAILYQFH